jgi:hypothetical protein
MSPHGGRLPQQVPATSHPRALLAAPHPQQGHQHNPRLPLHPAAQAEPLALLRFLRHLLRRPPPRAQRRSSLATPSRAHGHRRGMQVRMAVSLRILRRLRLPLRHHWQGWRLRNRAGQAPQPRARRTPAPAPRSRPEGGWTGAVRLVPLRSEFRAVQYPVL